MRSNWVDIRNAEYINDDTLPLLKACLERAQSHRNVNQVTISMQGRDKDGWLEFQILYEYQDGGKLVVGALQRKPGEQFEFHS